MTATDPGTTLALDARIETVLLELGRDLAQAPMGARGRPPILSAAVLWTSLTLGILRGAMSQLAIWRLVVDRDLWRGAAAPVSDEAVYRRLAAPGPSPLGTLFADVTARLLTRLAAADTLDLAPFAVDVVALDQTTLDPVARRLPALRAVPPGDRGLLPGQIAGLFDVRRQLWRAIRLIDDAHQNERVAARDLVATLTPGTLVLADLGYFGFEWFDDLTDAGYLWLSRLRAKTSFTVAHVFYEDATTFDGLVHLGAHRADRAKHAVRLVRFRTGTTERAFLTNVCSPLYLSPRQIAALYARRWDIEQAVNLVKRHLGLHLLWSAKPAVIHHQIWAVLLIAQLVQALRLVVAERAEVDVFDVSVGLLLQHLPRYAALYDDPVGAYVADGRLLGFIRPSRRVRITAPTIPKAQLIFPPPDLILTRPPRYAHRKCGSQAHLLPK
jgi:hypothetical protein